MSILRQKRGSVVQRICIRKNKQYVIEQREFVGISPTSNRNLLEILRILGIFGIARYRIGIVSSLEKKYSRNLSESCPKKSSYLLLVIEYVL